MELSKSFSIDIHADWVQKHNREAVAVVEAYEADRPLRVPVFCGEWPGQHGFYADEADVDYRTYYTDPDEMLRVQLEAARRRRELPIYDMVLGQPPPSWTVSVDLWPVVAPGWFGCELVYRKDAVIAHHPLALSKEQCRHLSLPDPRIGGILAIADSFLRQMKERYAGRLEFLGKPVGPFGNGIGTNGLFSLALDLYGADLMADMYDDPEFARTFLFKLGDYIDKLERAACEKNNTPVGPFAITDHGIDMLSPEHYEEFIVPVVRAINRQRKTLPPTFLHHCGRGSHLFPVIKRSYGLTHLHALTYPLIDIARVRRDVGEDVWIAGLLDDTVVRFGPPEQIRQLVKALMESGAKGRGRFSLVVGDMLKGTPLVHRVALYESVKEFGGYRR